MHACICGVCVCVCGVYMYVCVCVCVWCVFVCGVCGGRKTESKRERQQVGRDR